MLELVGWVANILFAIIGIPDVWRCYTKHVQPGSSWVFLTIWLVAQILAFGYLLTKDMGVGIYHYPMYFSYTFGGLSALLLMIAKRRFK